jgi:hypothetical protein
MKYHSLLLTIFAFFNCTISIASDNSLAQDRIQDLTSHLRQVKQEKYDITHKAGQQRKTLIEQRNQLHEARNLLIQTALRVEKELDEFLRQEGPFGSNKRKYQYPAMQRELIQKQREEILNKIRQRDQELKDIENKMLAIFSNDQFSQPIQALWAQEVMILKELERAQAL